jgi:hypothetical protein
MITGLARLLSKGIVKGITGLSKGSLAATLAAGKAFAQGGAIASKVPYWYLKQFKKLSIGDKIANLGNLGMFYKRNKRRWHDALNAGELIHPYNY